MHPGPLKCGNRLEPATRLQQVDLQGLSRVSRPARCQRGPLADVRGPQAVRDQRSGRLADQLAGQVAVQLPGAWSGPADRCHTCPGLLLCVRLLKLRPLYSPRRSFRGYLRAAYWSQAGTHAVRPARRGNPGPTAALRMLRACSRRLDRTGFHRLPVHGAPASRGPRAHELCPDAGRSFMPVRAGHGYWALFRPAVPPRAVHAAGCRVPGCEPPRALRRSPVFTVRVRRCLPTRVNPAF